VLALGGKIFVLPKMTQRGISRLMKLILSVFALVTCLAGPALAADTSLLKTCSTILSAPGSEKPVPTVVEVFAEGAGFVAKVTQTTDGQTTSYRDSAEVSSNKVRAGLSADSLNASDLNLAESLIVHAMMLTEDPLFQGIYDAGINLKAVRAAKVYLIGKPSDMGSTAIVEAKDELGKALGSFLGGFLVSACR